MTLALACFFSKTFWSGKIEHFHGRLVHFLEPLVIHKYHTTGSSHQIFMAELSKIKICLASQKGLLSDPSKSPPGPSKRSLCDLFRFLPNSNMFFILNYILNRSMMSKDLIRIHFLLCSRLHCFWFPKNARESNNIVNTKMIVKYDPNALSYK